ncbi:hypothetical protein R1flu_021174 [Riccia fluitans]|uniref:Uncharacterized protein n=1 Tax=Riccia fluitans TaxID=41844 RepID=A0ABD1ZQL1_9MARC
MVPYRTRTVRTFRLDTELFSQAAPPPAGDLGKLCVVTDRKAKASFEVIDAEERKKLRAAIISGFSKEIRACQIEGELQSGI